MSSSSASSVLFLLRLALIRPSAEAAAATDLVAEQAGFVPPPKRASARCSICWMSQRGTNNNSYGMSQRGTNNNSYSSVCWMSQRGTNNNNSYGDGSDERRPNKRLDKKQKRQRRGRRSNRSKRPYHSEFDSALGEITDADAYEASIDSFLEGEYGQPFADDAPAPHPGLTPSETLECALRSLRRMDEPFDSHGAAVFMRFCMPLTNSERWGLSSELDPWKTIVRGALSPNMLARQLRASSSFASLLDWTRIDVSEGFAIPSERLELGVGTTLAFVNAALYFEEGEPSIIQFTLRKIGGAWLIDDAQQQKRDWFVSPGDDEVSDDGDSGVGNDML